MTRHTPAEDSSPTARVRELRERTTEIRPSELDELWSALDTVDVQEILGTWRGVGLPTGHPLDGLMAKYRWYGKTFSSPSDVQPNICYDDGGNLYSNREIGNGEASLWNVEFRGEVTATMIYDGRPVLDHFKRVDDDTLFGIMNAKDIDAFGGHFYFLLERA